jgi:hypothetical protein
MIASAAPAAPIEVAAIQAARPHALFVALGAPRQDEWIARHPELGASVSVGVGGAFNFLAGLAGLVAVIIAVIVIHPLLLMALLVATTPGAWAAVKAGHQRYQTYVTGSARRRRFGPSRLSFSVLFSVLPRPPSNRPGLQNPRLM